MNRTHPLLSSFNFRGAVPDEKRPSNPARHRLLKVGVVAFIVLTAVAVGVAVGTTTAGSGDATASSSLGAAAPSVTPGPTPAPTIGYHTLTPRVDEPVPTGGVVRFSPSGEFELLRLTRTTLPLGPTLLAARSYGGAEWEAAPPLRVPFVCGTNADTLVAIAVLGTTASNRSAANCTATIPGGAGHRWQVETSDFSSDVVSNRNQAARFLIKSTWGPDRAAVAELLDAPHNGDAASWVAAEMAKTPTLHRAYFRQRSNPQLPQANDGQTAVHLPVAVRPTCAPRSRWSRYALSAADVGRRIVAALAAPGTTSFTINSILRTVVPNTNLPNLTVPGSFLVCSVTREVGGPLVLNAGSACNVSTNVQIAHPAVASPPANRVVVTSSNASRLAELTPPLLDTRVLVGGAPVGELGCDTAPQSGPLFAVIDGLGYVADNRIDLLGNTLTQPLRSRNAHPVLRSNCPTVPKTFLNADTCVTGVTTCAPLSFESVLVTLNESFIRQFYVHGGMLVYVANGLRLESVGSPCAGGTSRWVRRDNSPCTNAAATSPTLVALATDVIGDALSDPAVADNPIVRDVVVNNASCTDAAAVGIAISVNGTCWQHVHKDELNVYDFTTWAIKHPGGQSMIQQFALNGTVNLTFPASHAMSRWTSNERLSRNQINLLGKFGSTVDFATLPTNLLLDPIAESVGAIRSADVGHETCGSPGEVANEPSLGHHYKMVLGNGDPNAVLQAVDRLETLSVSTPRSAVWTNVVLRAPDQLRQRVAWALSQIFVVNVAGVLSKTNEVFMVYYDIFVRNAFGNYRDVLKEVSYSPMMGQMLTFTNTRSFAFGGAAPDENYAREVMQLFTIGLWELHPNGTQVRDRRDHACQCTCMHPTATCARTSLTLWNATDN
jgi:hypothetical protein